MSFKRTLKAAVDRGAEGVNVYCRQCSHSKFFYASEALERWGTDATFPEIARRSRCRKCGKPAFEAGPQWPRPPGSTGGWRVRPPSDWSE